jgi:transposase-like protein
MSKKKQRTYDKEFKQNAVNLYLNADRSYDEVGEELGIPGQGCPI